MDTYGLAVGSPLSLLTFFAAAKKVSAAPHRGEANRPLRIQGKANAVGKQKIKARPTPRANSTAGKQPKPNPNKPEANQATPKKPGTPTQTRRQKKSPHLIKPK
ncbi:MAG TPA: hypothetical protein VGH41_16775 [Paraburkholderia sp.]